MEKQPIGCGHDPTGADVLVNPNNVAAGSPGVLLNLTADSVDFFDQDQATWNGRPDNVTTTFNSASSISAVIDSRLLTAPGTVPVSVQRVCTGMILGFRPATVTVSATPTVNIITPSPLPSANAGAVYSMTFAATGGNLPYRWVLVSGVLPPGLTLGANGVLNGTPSTPGSFTFVVQATDSSGTSGSQNFVTSKSFTLVVNSSPNPTPNITSLSPSSTVVGSSSLVLTINGTNFVLGASVNFGPANLTPSSLGATQITVTVPANNFVNVATVQVSVTNPAPGGGQSNQKPFAITSAPLSITTTSPLPNGTVGVAYRNGPGVQLAAAGGTPPYTWTKAVSSTLPAGLNISSTGLVSGTPSAAGTFSFSVQVADAANQTVSAPFQVTIISGAPAITTASLPDGTQGTVYSQDIQATGGTGTLAWVIVSGQLPAGISLTTASGPTATISGIPTAVGSSTFTLQVADQTTPTPRTAQKSFTVTISSANNNPAPSITSLSPPSIPVGSSDLLLTINGTGFVSGITTVVFGTGNSQIPTFISSTQIQITVSASDLTNAGQVPVIVSNPAPGGGTARTNFTVTQMTFSSGAILTPGNLPAFDELGDTVVVGGGTLATVFVKNGDSWSQAAQLNNPAANVASVAISGDGKTVAIGDCSNNVCVGHAYVYVQPTGGWAGTLDPTATLSVVNAQAKDRIGFSVATDHGGDTVAVGAPCDFTAGNTLCGTVYVYAMPAGGWADKTEDAQLTVPSTATLGLSVSMDAAGATIIAGLPGVEASGNTPGAVYLFKKPGIAWTTTSSPDATFNAVGGANGDELGFSSVISSDGKTIVAGAPQHCFSGPCTLGQGAVYVFEQPAGGWLFTQTQTSILTVTNRQQGDSFGSAVSVSADGATVVVSAPDSPFTLPSTPGPGTAYVFLKPLSGWNLAQTETQLLNAFSGTDIFGNNVTPTSTFGGFLGGLSISGDGTTIGASGLATVQGTANPKVIYLFQ